MNKAKLTFAMLCKPKSKRYEPIKRWHPNVEVDKNKMDSLVDSIARNHVEATEEGCCLNTLISYKTI